MEASSPISAAIDRTPRAQERQLGTRQAPTKNDRSRRIATPATARQPLSDNAPSIGVPLRFMLTGLLALLAGMIWLVCSPRLLATYHYNQYVIAVTHLFVLGWICSIVMGAMYQLVPVALETRLHSERLARWQFVFHAVGFIGMVWMFSAWNLKQVGHFGAVLAVGVLLFVYNIARTLLKVPRWNVTATAVTAALSWVLFAITAGLSIAAAKLSYELAAASPSSGPMGVLVHGLKSLAGFVAHFDQISAMHAHAHLGVVGFFTLMIVGVSYKLIPMFTLSELQSPRRARRSVVLLNIGLAGAFITILLRSRWKLAFALVLIAALAFYARELAAILRARKRHALDWGIRYFLTAVAVLIPLSLLSLALSWPGLPLTQFTGQMENLYGFLGLIGFVTFAIVGMLYKIIPFLVWFGVYSRQIGRAQVPSLADMYSTRLQAIGYWTFLSGLAVTSVAILLSNQIAVQIGCSVLALSLLALALNVGLILAHFIRPQTRPLGARLQPVGGAA